jgi:hypothetical protein
MSAHILHYRLENSGIVIHSQQNWFGCHLESVYPAFIDSQCGQQDAAFPWPKAHGFLIRPQDFVHHADTLF